MTRFLLSRLANLVIIMLVVSAAVYLLLEINVDAVAVKALGAFSSEEQRRIWLEANGYFDPLVLRYFNWLGGVLTGDFGQSVIFKVPVADVLWPRLGNTALLGGITLAIVTPLSLFFGAWAGAREGSITDRSISLFAIITTTLPEFASAVFLSAIFVFALGWLPGISSMPEGFDFSQLILPVAVLVIYDFGYVTRMTRASMADVMMTPYIRTAILKGIPFRQIIWRHALRNALIAPFTVIMLQFTWLLSGVVVVEVFFAYRGIGSLLLEAALNQDVNVIEAVALISVFVAVATQTLGDIGYAYLNPRIRFGGNAG